MPGNVRPVVDERDGLLAYVAQQRDCLKITAFGLTEEQIRATPTAGTLSIGGLLKHCAAMERSWMDTVLQRPSSTTAESYGEDFRLTEDDTLASLLDDLDACAGETEEIVAGIDDLGQPVPVPDQPWFPRDVEA